MAVYCASRFIQRSLAVLADKHTRIAWTMQFVCIGRSSIRLVVSVQCTRFLPALEFCLCLCCRSVIVDGVHSLLLFPIAISDYRLLCPAHSDRIGQRVAFTSGLRPLTGGRGGNGRMRLFLKCISTDFVEMAMLLCVFCFSFLYAIEQSLLVMFFFLFLSFRCLSLSLSPVLCRHR